MMDNNIDLLAKLLISDRVFFESLSQETVDDIMKNPKWMELGGTIYGFIRNDKILRGKFGEKFISEFMRAAIENNLSEVQKFLHSGADISVEDINGKNALMLAAEKGCADVVDALLVVQEEVYASRKDNTLKGFAWGAGNNALMLAALNGHADVVEKLLKNARIESNANNYFNNVT